MPKGKYTAKRGIWERIIWERGGQITWRVGGLSTGEEYRGEGERGNMLNRGGTQTGPRRNPNTMNIDRKKGENRTCYICGKWDYIAKNHWERHKGRVVEIPQSSELSTSLQ